MYNYNNKLQTMKVENKLKPMYIQNNKLQFMILNR